MARTPFAVGRQIKIAKRRFTITEPASADSTADQNFACRGTGEDGQHVFIKVTRTEHSERLKREAEIATVLSCEHVNAMAHHFAKPVAHGDVGGSYYAFALDYLTDYGRWDLSQFTILANVTILHQLAARLKALHALGFVHRDVKPENVMVNEQGDVRLVDFGVSRISDSKRFAEFYGVALGASGPPTASTTANAKLTRVEHRTLIGTPEYMAPEQFDGPDTVAPAADVWSLGVCLFRILDAQSAYPFGECPNPGDRAAIDRLRDKQREQNSSPRYSLEALKDLVALCKSTLVIDPSQRPGLTAFEEALGKWLMDERKKETSPLPSAIPVPKRLNSASATSADRFSRIHLPMPIPLAIAGVLLGVFGLGVIASRSGTQTRSEHLASTAATPQEVAQLKADLSSTRDQFDALVRATRENASAVRDLKSSIESALKDQSAAVTEHTRANTTAIAELRATLAQLLLRGSIPPEIAPHDRFVWALRHSGTPAWYESLENKPPELPPGVVLGPGEREYTNLRDGSILVWVPPGTFTWNVDPAGNATITFNSGFFIGKYETTAHQWRTFSQATGLAKADSQPTTSQTPVVGISLKDAMAYARWAGGRLPTEAEWIYAAFGPSTKDRNPAPLAMTPEYANIANDEDGYPVLAPAGSFAKGVSPFGCMDMIGNAAEWTADRYNLRTPAGNIVDPEPSNAKGLEAKSLVMGGSFKTQKPDKLPLSVDTEAYRTQREKADDETGFRIVIKLNH